MQLRLMSTPVVFVLLTAVGAHAMPVIVNPGFEPLGSVPNYNAIPGGSNAIPGWTTTDTGAEWYEGSAFASESPTGGYVVDIANFIFSAGGIEQALTVETGESYTLGFYLGTSAASGRLGTAEIVVAATGALGSTIETYNIEGFGTEATWTYTEFSFVATDPEMIFSFRNTQDANLHFALIDGVTVVPTPAPAMLPVAAGALATRRRRR